MRIPSRADAAFQRFRSRGDPRALARLFDLTAPELARVALHLTGDVHQAEDLVQTTFLAVIHKHEDHEAGRPVLPWLLGILANRARALRKQEGRQVDPERLPVPGTEDGPLVTAERRETRDRLRQAIQDLPKPYREVLSLHLLHDMSAKDIAAALDRPAGTVRTQVVRGMERLRRSLPKGFVGGSLLLGLTAPSLANVRRVVLSQVPAAASVAVGLSLLGGVLAMKPLTGAVVVAVLAGATWVMWPDGEGSDQGVDPKTSSDVSSTSQVQTGDTPPVAGTREALPDSGAGDPNETGAGVAATQPMLIVQTVHDETGAPAPDIRVRLGPLGVEHGELHEQRVTTDAQGTARVEHLTNGRWSVIAGRGGPAVEVDLVQGESHTVELRVPPGVQVHGKVLDEVGQPVAGAAIWLSQAPRNPDQGVWVTESDKDGRFQLAGVALGRMVSAAAEGFLPSYCSTIEENGSGTQELVLELARGGGVLRGIVVDAAGTPVPHATVMAGYTQRRMRMMREDVRPGHRTWTDEQGRFEFLGVFAGHPIPLWARAPGFAPHHGKVLIREGAQEVRIGLKPGAVLRGMVRDEHGATVARERVQVFHFAIEPGANMSWQGPDWGRPAGATNDAGEFEITELPAGRVRLTVEHNDWMARHEFELAEGDEQYWDAVLQPPPGILGVLKDESGQPLSAWDVWADTREKGAREPQWTQSDQEGRFRLEPCDDLEYVLMARAAESAMDQSDYRQAGVRPDPEEQEFVVPAARIASGWLTGVIRDHDGPLTERLSVDLLKVRADGTEESAGNEPTFEGERFLVGPVVPGHYRVRVGKGNGFVGLELGEFDVAREETVDVGTHTLPEPGFLHLRVTDANGSPLAESRFALRQVGSSHGQVVTVTGGEGRSQGMAAGTYVVRPFGGRVPLISQDVEIRGGETTTVDIHIPHSVARRLRFPIIKDRDILIEMSWWDSAGRLLQDGRGSYPSQPPFTEGYEYTRYLIPGTYDVELRRLTGESARATFVIDDREDPDAVLELPDPWR